MKTEPKIFLVGNAHLDPVWLWRWQEGYAEIKATFRSALDRMIEFPEFIFTCSSAALCPITPCGGMAGVSGCKKGI